MISKKWKKEEASPLFLLEKDEMERYEGTPLKLKGIIEPVLHDMGYSVIRVKKSDTLLQVMIEKPDLSPVSIEDCEKVSKQLSVILDVEDIIHGSYTLEVGSGGLDRPLIDLEDFKRFVNSDISVNLISPVNDTKKLTGALKNVRNDLTIELDVRGSGILHIPYSNIKKAKLLLTDNALNSTLKRK